MASARTSSSTQTLEGMRNCISGTLLRAQCARGPRGRAEQHGGHRGQGARAQEVEDEDGAARDVHSGGQPDESIGRDEQDSELGPDFVLVLVLVRRDYVSPFRTPSVLPTFVNASTARSMWAVVCAAETCTRMRERPRGTTGKKNPLT